MTLILLFTIKFKTVLGQNVWKKQLDDAVIKTTNEITVIKNLTIKKLKP